MGIDGALSQTGFVIVDYTTAINVLKEGVIKTSSRDSHQKRLFSIYKSISKLMKDYKPSQVIIEKLYSHSKHPTTVWILGEVRGIILLCCAQNNVPVYEYSSTHMRKSLVGKGNAKDYQLKRMASMILKREVSSSHIVDALALVLAHIHTLRYKNVSKN